MITVWTIVLLLVATHGYGAALGGQVRDGDTGEGLPAATLQIKGTYQGTVANGEGEYFLELGRYPAVIRVSYIGYRSREIEVSDPNVTHLDIELKPAPLLLRETIITDEDPAERIMRQVISRKQQWRPRIQRFKARAYSRWSMRSDAEIIGIGEVVADIYWDRKEGWREVVKSRRLSDNILADRKKEDEDFSFAESFFNLYDDEMDILDHRVIGPTHPEALKHYRFRIVGQRHMDDQVVYDISVRPRNKLQSTLSGHLAVLDGDFALLEAELRPARHIVEILPLPFLSIKELSFKQQFRCFEGGVWLPVDFRSEAEGSLSMALLFSTPSIGFSAVSRLAEYEVNVDLPDSVYAVEAAVQVDTVSMRRDSLFVEYGDKVPLSPREEAAYQRLDSTQTLDRLIKLKGPLGRMVQRDMDKEREKVLLKKKGASAAKKKRLPLPRLVPQAPYNRVDGLYLGLGAQSRVAQRFLLSADGGYSLGTERWSGGLGAEWAWGDKRRGWIGAHYRKYTRRRHESALYSPLMNSTGTLLGFGDYFDYYRSEGTAAEIGYAFDRPRLRVLVGIESQKHISLEKSTNFELVPRHDRLRPNPAIDAGRLRSALLRLELGKDYVPFGLGRNKRLTLEAEYSADWMESDFSFARYGAVLDWHIETFWRRRLAPNALDLRLVGGFSRGELPVQRFAAVDVGSGPFTPFGALRSVRGQPYEGEHYAAVFWEHNFKSIPFEILGLGGLARRGFGLVLHGAAGRTWIDADRRARLGYGPRWTDGWHHEAGVSLQLYHLWRLDLIRRLDRGGWHLGIGVARLG
jgi:hypothetical protein